MGATELPCLIMVKLANLITTATHSDVSSQNDRSAHPSRLASIRLKARPALRGQLHSPAETPCFFIFIYFYFLEQRPIPPTLPPYSSPQNRAFASPN